MSPTNPDAPNWKIAILSDAPPEGTFTADNTLTQAGAEWMNENSTDISSTTLADDVASEDRT